VVRSTDVYLYGLISLAGARWKARSLAHTAERAEMNRVSVGGDDGEELPGRPSIELDSDRSSVRSEGQTTFIGYL